MTETCGDRTANTKRSKTPAMTRHGLRPDALATREQVVARPAIDPRASLWHSRIRRSTSATSCSSLNANQLCSDRIAELHVDHGPAAAAFAAGARHPTRRRWPPAKSAPCPPGHGAKARLHGCTSPSGVRVPSGNSSTISPRLSRLRVSFSPSRPDPSRSIGDRVERVDQPAERGELEQRLAGHVVQPPIASQPDEHGVEVALMIREHQPAAGGGHLLASWQRMLNTHTRRPAGRRTSRTPARPDWAASAAPAGVMTAFFPARALPAGRALRRAKARRWPLPRRRRPPPSVRPRGRRRWRRAGSVRAAPPRPSSADRARPVPGRGGGPAPRGWPSGRSCTRRAERRPFPGRAPR